MPRVTGYDELWATGIGAYYWTTMIHTDGNHHKALILLVPDVPDRPDKPIPVCLYVDRQPDNWSAPGHVRAWDGDEDYPTLTPSIWVNDRKGWHGFLTKGVLVDA